LSPRCPEIDGSTTTTKDDKDDKEHEHEHENENENENEHDLHERAGPHPQGFQRSNTARRFCSRIGLVT
jgi:hypothetical protein